MSKTVKDPTLLDALLPLSALVTMLGMAVYLFSADSSGGANQVALLMAAFVAMLVGIKNGLSWKHIEAGMVQSVGVATPAILILLSVGALIGAWILSGTVPAMIYYGMKILNPQYFYAASCLMCALVGLAIGSSWTVAGTLGIALIGIAQSTGMSLEITAGAVVSGAYFGDKMSPLSDTTNLAPAVAGTDIFSHIRHMMWTTTPAIVTALVIFLLIGLNTDTSHVHTNLESTLTLLEQQFHIGPHLLLPLVVLIYLARRKVPAFATIIIGALTGLICALLFQFDATVKLAQSPELSAPLAAIKGLWIATFNGYSAETGDKVLDELLSRGGMSGMLNTIWLILCAMAFGGVMEATGLLSRLLNSMLSMVQTSTSLVISTLASAIGTNIIAADQYIAIILPGRMLRIEYQRHNLAPVNLSRALEDSATVTSPLVPWNTCGAFMASTLGVATLAYLPFAFFNYLCPLISGSYAYFHIKMLPLEHINEATPQSA